MAEEIKMAAKAPSRDVAQYDVVVVGAGLAGLTTALNIVKKEPQLTVLILEARDRVGGRTLTVPMKASNGREEMFDLGGQWVGPSQHHINSLLKELNIETFPQNASGTKVMQLGGHKARTYKSNIPSFGSVWALIEFQLFVWNVERMVQKVPMAAPYASDLAQELDGLTVAAFAEQHLRTKAAREAIDVAMKVTFGTDATRIGALYFLAYAQAAGGMMKLFEVKHAAQESRVKGGTQPISEKLADLVGREKILLERAVTAVDQTGEDGMVLVTYDRVASAGSDALVGCPTVVKARKVVMAAPPNLLKKVAWSPPLHPLKRYICENLHMGHLYKFVVTYEKATWLERGYSGEIVSNGGPQLTPDCSGGPLCITFDATSSGGAPAIVGFFGGRAAVEWEQKTREEREAAVTQSLATLLGTDLLSYVSYEEKLWGVDPWAGGCPECYAGPGTMYAMPHLRTPHADVHFVGTETATEWTGYMSGAVQSGERGALEVLAGLRPDSLSGEQLRRAGETSHPPPQQLASAPPPMLLLSRCLLLTGLSVAAVMISYLF